MLKVETEEEGKFFFADSEVSKRIRGSFIQLAHIWKLGFFKKLTFRRIMFYKV